MYALTGERRGEKRSWVPPVYTFRAFRGQDVLQQMRQFHGIRMRWTPRECGGKRLLPPNLILGKLNGNPMP